MNYQEMSSWFYNGDGIKLADEIYNQFNLKFFPPEIQATKWVDGLIKKFYYPLISKGLKFRMPGLGGEVLKVLELMLFFYLDLMSFPLFPLEQLMELNGLDQRLIWVRDYIKYVNITTILDGMNLELVWKHLLISSHGITLIMTKRLVETCYMKSNSAIASEFFARNSFAMKKLNDEFKVNFVKYPKQLLKTLNERSSEVVFDYANKDNLGKKILRSISEYRKLFMFWSEYSEKVFKSQE